MILMTKPSVTNKKCSGYNIVSSVIVLNASIGNWAFGIACMQSGWHSVLKTELCPVEPWTGYISN
jgi:hypothetical protein